MRGSALRLSVVAALVAASGSGVAVSGQVATSPQVSFAEPGISPDGREIAFVSGGDIWTVPGTGGDARLLVAHDATESRPLFSPNGRMLAFVSTRTGGGDIYLLTIDTGVLRRVTADDGLEQLDSWSRDGRWIYFSSTSRDIAGMNDVYRVSADGGTPMAVTADRYTNEFGASPSPDGTKIVFSARGNGSGQWWRKAGSHLDQAELWLAPSTPSTTASSSAGSGQALSTGSGQAVYTQLTARDGRALWPMWSADGKSIFYVTDRNGAENLWKRAVGDRLPAGASAQAGALTRFTDGRVLWPSITADGRTIAFERNFGIWTADSSSGQARELKITRRGTPTLPVPERTRQTNQFSDLALSPDGKKVAFVARGELFAASAADAGDAMRVTNTPAIESQPVWSADSRKLAYVSARDSGQHIYLYDFLTNKEEALTSGTGRDLSPTMSPDGKSLLYLRDLRDLRVIDLESKQDRSIWSTFSVPSSNATGAFGDALDSPRPTFSPDGRWIALFAIGEKQFNNVHLVPFAADATPKIMQPVSFLANVYANTIAWGHDGSFLLFDTNQRTESGQLARVDLTLRTPKFREDAFRDLFNQPASAKAPAGEPAVPASEPASPVRPVFADIRQRLSLLPTGIDVQSVSVSPDGKTAVLIAAAAGQQNLYAWPLDELAATAGVARQLTSTASGKSDIQFSPDSKEVFYLDNGRISAVSLDRREVRGVNVTAEFMLDFDSEKIEVFNQAWSLLRDNFFDAKFNGVDWDAARRAYLPRVAGAATADEMRRIVRLMIGDLNASHLGFTGGVVTTNGVGRLGLSFDRAEYESSGRLKITALTLLGPAAITRAINVGDLLTAVDGKSVARVNLDELLANTIDRRVTLTLATSPGGPTRDVVIKPVNQGTEKHLLYRQWVEANRAYVLKKSGGRLGYVHMLDMGQGSLDQLFIDLDAENHSRDGVVVDIRNNNGGFVNAYALDALTRQPYLRMSLRGLPTAPARVVLGQRALEKPTALVINQHSLSDAEDFTEGYRTLKLGPIVGEPTAGWIIYTWNVRLVDGSTLRLPRMRITAVDGTDMERHSRPVDIAATRPIGETMTDRDSQLDAAIRALLAKLGRAE